MVHELPGVGPRDPPVASAFSMVRRAANNPRMSTKFALAVGPILATAVCAQVAPDQAWRDAEAPFLANAVQLTSRDEFVKAGEAYFSPDGKWIIFQAVPVPEAGKDADPFYAMYVGRVVRSHQGGVAGLRDVARVSPPGSANTCGWFHPAVPGELLLGSTLVRPAEDQKSGFQVGSRKYVWMFPSEMEIVRAFYKPMWEAQFDARDPSEPRPLSQNTDDPPAALFGRPNYDAECSYDPSGRFVLYAHIENELQMGRPDANIYVFDTVTREHHPIVVAPGYDGGPFFSPDARSICYRSDRKGDDLLQIFVADLKFEDGVPVGITREYQLTSGDTVNWAPFWHPSGRFLVYGTSEVSHGNYEVFAIEIDRDLMHKSAEGVASGAVQVPAKRVRITQAQGADVLPVFSPDGRSMMWTAQRGPLAPGESKPSSQLWAADWVADPFSQPR